MEQRTVLCTYRQHWTTWVMSLSLLLVLLVSGHAGHTTTENASDVPPLVILPLGENDPRAFTEKFLAHTPGATLQAAHMAILWLEPVGGDEEDTGVEEGVDAVPYFFAQETRLRLRIHASADVVQQLVLKDSAGGEVARLERHGGTSGFPLPKQSKRRRGYVATTVVAIPPGVYTLEVHHAHKGQVDALGQRVFLRPVVPRGKRGTAAAEEFTPVSDAVPASVTEQSQTVGSNTATLAASADCENCNFDLADLTGQDFSGLNLSGSTFTTSLLVDTVFQKAVMVNCKIYAFLVRTDFTGANLTGAHFDGAVGGNCFELIPCPPGGNILRFTRATLDQTTWGPRVIEGENIVVSATIMVGADFSKASIKGVLFNGTWLDGGQFQGATIDSTSFQTSGFALQYPGDDASPQDPAGFLRTSCRQCDFSSDPSHNIITTLGLTAFDGADLTDAVFTGTLLDQVGMVGTVLAGVDFRFIAPASVISSDFSGDLTGANFSGFNFSGLDLSHADFSKAILSSLLTGPVDANFAGATFSDGVHGVNLAGHAFPKGFTQFKGANLAYANLNGVNLFEADLGGANLTSVQLHGANLTSANLLGATMRGLQAGVAAGSGTETSLSGAYMPNADLTDADLRSADLTGAHIYAQSLLIRTKLDSASLSQAILTGAAFSGSMTTAVFTGAQLINCTFNGATLTNTKFDGAYLQGADFTGALSVSGAIFTNAAFSTATQCLAGDDTKTPPCAWTFTEANGAPFIFGYEATVLGTLATDRSVICPSEENGPCTGDKLIAKRGGPYPPQPSCVPLPPGFCNCIPKGQSGSCAP